MCCFSKNVKFVADTNIFARPSKDGRQFLVYSMKFSAAEDLAMILPIPTPKNSKEDAVQFISLEKYPGFFDEMVRGFPVPQSAGRGGPKLAEGGLGLGLKVVEVGSFVASFVPSLRDFARLDAQFRIPDSTWAKLPLYKNWGFAVFKLKKNEKPEGKKIHPMAFEFPRADRGVLFFPTVHIHDGTVPKRAKFDHMLFAQFTGSAIPMTWEESPRPAELFMRSIKQSRGIVAGSEHVYRKVLKGVYKNMDVVV